jgi:hypothetical protein
VEFEADLYGTSADPCNNIPAPDLTSGASFAPRENVPMDRGVGVSCALPAVGQSPLKMSETAFDLESFLLSNMENDSIDDAHFESEVSTFHLESEGLDTSNLQTPIEAFPLLGCSPVDSLLNEWLNLP